MDTYFKVTREINWYSRHMKESFVRANITITFPDGTTQGKDCVIQEEELNQMAMQDRRTAWEEGDLCKILNCVLPADHKTSQI